MQVDVLYEGGCAIERRMLGNSHKRASVLC